MVVHFCLIVALGSTATRIDEKLPSDARVKELLIQDIFDTEPREELVRLGEKLFPTYHRLLNAPNAAWWHHAGVFDLVARSKGDRSAFLEPAVAGLGHKHVTGRRAALRLLAEIGTTKETPPILALLSDKEWTLCIAAAEALTEMGDQRTLAALNVWLNSSAERTDKSHTEVLKHITKARDDLKARLEKAKPPGK